MCMSIANPPSSLSPPPPGLVTVGDEVVTYEDVMKMDAHSQWRRPIVLIGEASHLLTEFLLFFCIQAVELLRQHHMFVYNVNI